MCAISYQNKIVNLERKIIELKGYALIEYETFNEAKNALTSMNGKEINGQKITVSWAFVKGPSSKKNASGNRRSRSRSRERR